MQLKSGYGSCFIANDSSVVIGLDIRHVTSLFPEWVVTVSHPHESFCVLQILKTNFYFKQQRAIELIREEKGEEATAYCKKELTPLVEENVRL